MGCRIARRPSLLRPTAVDSTARGVFEPAYPPTAVASTAGGIFLDPPTAVDSTAGDIFEAHTRIPEYLNT